jgi:hypothetical protein
MVLGSRERVRFWPGVEEGEHVDFSEVRELVEALRKLTVGTQDDFFDGEVERLRRAAVTASASRASVRFRAGVGMSERFFFLGV